MDECNVDKSVIQELLGMPERNFIVKNNKKIKLEY